MRRPLIIFVLAIALVAAACGGGDDKKTASTTTKASTTSVAPTPSLPANVAPLTGLSGDPAKLRRPALVVKIDNAPKARPQAGINQADIVIEEGVEGGITRFATVFHSADADPVGPVRSARSSDLAIATPLRRPLFAYSGTNGVFQKLLDSSSLVNVGVSVVPGAYRRMSGRPAPYNLFSSTPPLFARAPKDAAPPPPLFTYRAPGVAANGSPAPKLHVEFRGRVLTSIDWEWDAGAGMWVRTLNGSPHVDAAGQRVKRPNVVVLFVLYRDTGLRDQSGEPVPEAQLEGQGEAWVLTDGRVVKGKWVKPAVDAVPQLLDSAGAPIGLTPGQTWVELPKPGMAGL